MGFTISFAGAKDFTPYEGGGDLFPFEGLTRGPILKIEEAQAKESKNQMLVFTIGCDEPEGKGLKVKKWVPVTGMRSDGKPNVIGLLEAIASVYSENMSNEDAVAKARGLEGQNLDSALIMQQLMNKIVYYEVKSRSYQRDDGTTAWSSELSNFKLKGQYTDMKNVGSHHRNLPPNVGQQQGGGQAQSGGQSGGSQGGQQAQGNQQQNGTAQQTQSSQAKSGALGIL